MSAPEGVRAERRQDVLWLVLDRPQAANALDGPLQSALRLALERAATERAVHAVVLGGAGRAFSAGADLKEVWDADPVRAAGLRAAALLSTLLALLDFPKPAIAAVAGKAVGAGCMLALLADETWCAETATFHLPEITLGMPTPLGAAILAARGGSDLVQRLVQGGERLSAADGMRAGLPVRVCGDAPLEEHAQRRALLLGGHPPGAYAANKAFINAPLRAALLAAAEHAGRLRAAQERSDDRHAT